MQIHQHFAGERIYLAHDLAGAFKGRAQALLVLYYALFKFFAAGAVFHFYIYFFYHGGGMPDRDEGDAQTNFPHVLGRVSRGQFFPCFRQDNSFTQQNTGEVVI